MIDRRFINNFNWSLLLLVLVLMVVGVINLYSASRAALSEATIPIYQKQIYLAVIGLLFMIVVIFFDYHFLLPLAYPLFWINIGLLILVLWVGKTVAGSQRWLSLAGLAFQPSEAAKIALILALAKYFTFNEPQRRYGFRDLFLPFGMALLPALLIIKQPDLGTALLLLMTSVSLFLFLGVDRKTVRKYVNIACSPLIRRFLKGVLGDGR